MFPQTSLHWQILIEIFLVCALELCRAALMTQSWLVRIEALCDCSGVTYLTVMVTLRVGRRPLQLHFLTWSWGPWRSVPRRSQPSTWAGVGSWGILQGGPRVTNTGGIVLSVLQPGYQPLVLLAEVAAHQGGLANYHHVLGRRGVNSDTTHTRGVRMAHLWGQGKVGPAHSFLQRNIGCCSGGAFPLSSLIGRLGSF